MSVCIQPCEHGSVNDPHNVKSNSFLLLFLLHLLSIHLLLCFLLRPLLLHPISSSSRSPWALMHSRAPWAQNPYIAEHLGPRSPWALSTMGPKP